MHPSATTAWIAQTPCPITLHNALPRLSYREAFSGRFAVATASPSQSFFARNEFLIRRLHSLTGLAPVGAYMCIHLATNATVLDGTRSFQSRVDMIHSLGKFLPLVEWTFIFLPLIFHAVVGVAIIRSGDSNLSSYPLQGNVRYFLQRLTAWIALLFIGYHVFQMHGWIKPIAAQFGGAQFSHLYATSSAAAAVQSSLLVEIIYLVGILSCVYHLANGIWTSGITWGLWTTAAAQRRANWICGGFGLALTAVALGALGGMMQIDVQKSLTIEDKINVGRVEDGEETAEEVEHARPKLSPSEPPATAAQASAAGNE